MKKGGYEYAKVETEEAYLVSKWDIKTIEKAQELWMQGKVAAAENLRNMENTTDEGGVRFKARDIETVTDEKAEQFLEWAEYGEFNDNTYIPMRKDTPYVLIASTKGLATGEISNLPILIPVGKQGNH